jgi:hypothetical protein
MGNLPCMGLILRFRLNPSPRSLDHADDSLPAGMHVHVLDRYLLLALAALAIERVEPAGAATSLKPTLTLDHPIGARQQAV